MDKLIKAILLWVLAIVITLASAVYQKMTGPTYPIRGKTSIAGQTVRYQLIRSYNLSDEAKVKIIVPDTVVKGEITFRRFKSHDSWTTQPMLRSGDTLIGALTHLPPAGKIMYQVSLHTTMERVTLNPRAAILRYTGYVPMYILIPHILCMFMAMLFSTLTGLVVIFRGRFAYQYAWITLITLTIGGLFLGPIVQKFAFDAFWTGWPFGHDLTDNKSLVAFIFWALAVWFMKKNRDNRVWPVIASIVLMVVFMIPHSMLGSEIDYTKEKTEAGK